MGAQLGEQLFCRGDGATPRWNTAGTGGGRDQPAPHQLRQVRIHQVIGPSDAGRRQLCNDTISIGDQHRFPAGSEANVFGELVFQNFQADGTHF
jgi:hypothetical protein